MLKPKRVYEVLESIVGTENVSEANFVRQAYSKSVDPFIPPKFPSIVVRPESAKEVSLILKSANTYKIAVYPRGAGCDHSGGAIPHKEGGIVMELTRMNKIIDVDTERTSTATVEAGVTWAQLNYLLSKEGYSTGCMGPNSGMATTIGGALSVGSGGGGGYSKHGIATEHCVGLEVVLPTGDVLAMPELSKTGLQSILLGDCGIFGIKTKAKMMIYPIPKYHEAKTFSVSEPTPENVSRIWSEYRKKGGLGLYDLYYFPRHELKLLGKIFRPLEDLKSGIFFYVTEADKAEVLEANTKTLDLIARKFSAEELEPEIENGNIAKFWYEEYGHWQLHHIAGTLGPGSVPTWAGYQGFIGDIPRMEKFALSWIEKNSDLIAKAGSWFGFFFLAYRIAQKFDGVWCGLETLAFNKPDYWDINERLWRDYIVANMRFAPEAFWGKAGLWLSQLVIDEKYLSGSEYDFLKRIKQALDPNCICSPGKFYL
jgi:FAD/FMN-containing dehydrogenase